MEINNFLKNRVEKDENLQLQENIPEFLFKNEDIINELKKIDENDLNEMFFGVFIALNQLGDKLFRNDSSSTLTEEFKFKVKNYNENSYKIFFQINDLILSDLITDMEVEFKENGLKPFYDKKTKSRRFKNQII